jgi:GDP-L-fucose synthase
MSYRSGVVAADFHPDTRAFFHAKPVLVLGGSGFIGSHVVEQLLELGARPRVLTRSSAPPFLRDVAARVDIRVGDLRSLDEARSALDGQRVVLNLAARVAGIEFNKAHAATMFMDNMELFFVALRAAAEAKVERFLVTSSACVYPRICSIPTPESEGFRDEPEPTNRGYGWAKRMEEMVAAAAADEFGLRVAIARPYNAYGPRDDFDPDTSHVLPSLIRKAFAARDGTFPVWGDGSHSRSFLHVDDFARGVIEVAARHPVAHALNLGTAEETTIRAAATLIAGLAGEMTGRSIRPVFDPSGITGQPRRACDTSLAKSILGYEARVPLADGLRRTMQWYVDEYCAGHPDA